jgi:hypothetical protein
LALSAAVLKEKGGPILQAGAPISCIIKRESRKVELRYSAPPDTEVDVFTGWKPKTVRLGEKAVRNWKFKDGHILLELPTTEGQMTIER